MAEAHKARLNEAALIEAALAVAGAVVIGLGVWAIFGETAAEMDFQKALLKEMKDQFRWHPLGVSATGFALVVVGALMMAFAAAIAGYARIVALHRVSAKPAGDRGPAREGASGEKPKPAEPANSDGGSDALRQPAPERSAGAPPSAPEQSGDAPKEAKAGAQTVGPAGDPPP